MVLVATSAANITNILSLQTQPSRLGILTKDSYLFDVHSYLAKQYEIGPTDPFEIVVYF